MLSSKLRSWMEAVRPRKKQQRKEKQLKSNVPNCNGTTLHTSQFLNTTRLSDELFDNSNYKSSHAISSHPMRYSGTNLSSPESAYSTGYSTDGTSPGAPPDYYVKAGNRYFSSVAEPEKTKGNCTLTYNNVAPHKTPPSCDHHLPTREESHVSVTPHATLSMNQDYDNPKNSRGVALHGNLHPPNGVVPRLAEVTVNSNVTSPRQRNRIRTNPWLPGNSLSPGNSCVGLHARSDLSKPLSVTSPVPLRFLNQPVSKSPNMASVRRISPPSSSSSSSSVSSTSVNWGASLVCRSPRENSLSDEEEDCTLNEMMGRYDESYIYEKETDILSDSDPTDCDTDVDTGQDGGDEDDPLEHEIDFIDNGSLTEFYADGKDIRNTGHCTYYNYERKVSRRKTVRRSQKQESKQLSERRRSSSTKRKAKTVRQSVNCHQMDGSRSAGATPLSARKTKHHPLSKLVGDENLRKRSNSVSFGANVINVIDQRDKEADKKYKELIVEAEHIIMSMKTNGLSPRRLPGPPNKRVELLRNAESTKPDSFIKNRLIDDTANLHLSRIPSNNFSSPRFSPKKNHITNFINNNSPVLMRRSAETCGSPLPSHKEQYYPKALPNSPLLKNKYVVASESTKRSPKYRRRVSKGSLKTNKDFSSDSEEELRHVKNIECAEFCCPQSEPVKRKVYNNESKTVAFNLNGIDKTDSPVNGLFNHSQDENKNSSENLRQQVLLNTIASLKRSLEDQSASLRQVYRSSHNIKM